MENKNPHCVPHCRKCGTQWGKVWKCSTSGVSCSTRLVFYSTPRFLQSIGCFRKQEGRGKSVVDSQTFELVVERFSVNA